VNDRERGSSIVEFALLGSLIFGVLVQTIVLFGVLHRATLATSAAAREYGRAIVVADSPDEARQRGALVVEQAARNHGLAPGSLQATVEGRRARGELLRVHVRTEVAVFRVPFLGDVVSSVSVPVEATHVVQIDRYRSGS
jgi:Flp pilus assembly protein TadG